MSNSTLKSKFTPFWACEFVRAIRHHQLKSVFPNLDQKCILALLRSLLILGLIDLDLQFHFISNMCFFHKLCVSYSFASVCIYLVRPSPVNAPHSPGHRTYVDSSTHVERVPPWTMKQSSFISWCDHQSSMSRRLGDWHWILQAPIGFRQIIPTSHAAILYANNWQSPKQQ